MATSRYSIVIRLLTLTLVLLSIVSLACADEQQVLDPSFDGTLNHIKYEAASAPLPARYIAAKEKLLARIKKENPEVGVSNLSPRYWLLRALYGYWRHGQRFQNDVQRKSNRYFSLKDEHRIVGLLPVAFKGRKD